MEPEYEACAALGSNLLISDINAVIKANDLCNRLGMDIISTGGTIGFAMECFEKGILSLDDTRGVNLEFGNVEAVLSMIEMIGRREGFGNILAEGEKRAAEIIGRGAIEYAVHVKGMTPQFHDPRAGVIRGLGDAVATGVDDGNVSEWGGPNPEFGLVKPLDRATTDGKAAYLIKMQARWIFIDSIGACNFACFRVPVRLMAETLSAATGWSVGFEQVMEVGDRVTQLRRVFNIKCGAKPEDDTLPPRILNHVHPEGGAKGVKVDLKPMLDEYYRLRKWDPKSGLPAREELERLGLGKVAKEIYG
jgi:aldehyde:ferredoxin oxidoreductase